MDLITPREYSWSWMGIASHTKQFGPIHHAESVYRKPIPEAVLLTIIKIRESFPEVEFQVTDITEMPKGDPFLRVGLHEKWFIIERWDEPGFRM